VVLSHEGNFAGKPRLSRRHTSTVRHPCPSSGTKPEGDTARTGQSRYRDGFWRRKATFVRQPTFPEKVRRCQARLTLARAGGRSSDLPAIERIIAPDFLLVAPSQPIRTSGYFATSVLAYRCGAVPDSHRIPYYSRRPERRGEPQAREANPQQTTWGKANRHFVILTSILHLHPLRLRPGLLSCLMPDVGRAEPLAR